MKISRILALAAVLLIAATLISCKEDGGLGLLGATKASALQPFDSSATVATEAEALALLGRVIPISGSSTTVDFLSKLGAAYTEAYDAADPKITPDPGAKKVSSSVSINDSTKLMGKVEVRAATIKGKVSESTSSNKPLSQLYSGTLEAGDSLSESTSEKVDFAITDGFYVYESTPYGSPKVTYKVAGYITAETKDESKKTLKKKATDTTDDQYERSSSSLYRVSVSLTISDGAKGGKFIFSSSSENSGSARSINSAGESVYSDIEVYDNANKLLFTIKSKQINPSLITGRVLYSSYW